MNLPQSSPLLT